MSSSEPTIKFSNQESISNLKAKVGQNVLNLVELTRSVVKSSDTSEQFRNCIRNFTANEATIEQSFEKYKKINIISNQLNDQVDQLHKDCESLGEICKQIDSIQKKTTHYNIGK